MSDYLHQKHFTLDEARRELTAVHALASKLVELKKQLDAKGWDVYRHQYFGGRGPNGARGMAGVGQTSMMLMRLVPARPTR